MGFFGIMSPVYGVDGVDVVLVSDNLRVMNLTQNVTRGGVNEVDFAIQNTSDNVIVFDFHIRGSDVFHDVFLGESYLQDGHKYRLISSDDNEMTALKDPPLRFMLTLQPGDIKRFLLIGQIPKNASFWIWQRHYWKQMEAKKELFRKTLLSVIGIFALLCLPTAMKFQHKRLILPAILAVIFAMILYLRWYGETISGGVNSLRVLIVLASGYIFLSHRALRRMPWTERRYWQTVILFVDLLLILNISGWVWFYFNPTFLDSFSAEWLEMFFAMTPLLVCLAVILYLRDPSPARQSPDKN